MDKDPTYKMGALFPEEIRDLLMSADSPDVLQVINTHMHDTPIQEDIDVSTLGGAAAPDFQGLDDFQNPKNPQNQNEPPVSPSIVFGEEWNWAYDLRQEFIRNYEEDRREYLASLAPTPASTPDGQLNGHDNGDDDIGEDGSSWPPSSTLTPGAQDLLLMDHETYQPETHQAQTYEPVYVHPEPFQIQDYQQDQPALQQMQPFVARQVHSQGRPQVNQPEHSQQQIIFAVSEQLQQPQAQPAAHLPPQVSESYIPVSRASTRKPATYGEPTRHRIPNHIEAYTQEQKWLLPKLNHFTHEYQGYIKTQGQAHLIGGVFLSLAHHEVTVTPPEFDLTFPRTSEAYCARLKELFDAIVDWSGTGGWRTKMGPKLASQWVEEVKTCRKKAGLSVEPQDMLDHQIEPPADRMPSFEEQWKNVVHRKMSDIEIEILSSKILDSAMLSQQDRNFIPLWSNNECQWEQFAILIHSAIRSSWLSRITNSPVAELVRKANNKAGNDKKRNAANRQNVQVTKRVRSEESDDEEEDRKIKKQRF
ncbi:hypothetical protein IL306_002413 [Fusarium sp. DS 682]|nr:hypothetical protein IL306_002413 [Fusarium sp. DS 682]